MSSRQLLNSYKKNGIEMIYRQGLSHDEKTNRFTDKVYTDYINDSIEYYMTKGLIKHKLLFKHQSSEFWREEHKKTEPHYLIFEITNNKHSLLDDYVNDIITNPKLNNTQRGKKVQILKTLQKQFGLYETAAKDTDRTQAYNKLYTIRSEKSTFVDNLEFKKYDEIEKNALVRKSGDIKSVFFTNIKGLRQEINNTLQKVDDIVVPNVLNDDYTRCKSLGTHHIFRWYYNKTQECIDKLNNFIEGKLNIIPESSLEIKKTLFTCACGSEDISTNGKARHERSIRHMEFISGKKDEIVLCQDVEKTVEKADEIVCQVVENTVAVESSQDHIWSIVCYTIWRNKINKCLDMIINKRFTLVKFVPKMVTKFETELKNEIIGPCIINVKDEEEDEEEEDEEEEDEEEEDEEEEDEEEDDEEPNEEEVKRESNNFNELIVSIEKIEKQKLSRDENEIYTDLCNRGRRDDETQFHLILESDADILRKRNVIGTLTRFKMYDIHSKSKLHDKIEKMIVDKIFTLFVTIKTKYNMYPPSREYLEKFGKIIYKHSRINELL
jgi:hypothetical protein